MTSILVSDVVGASELLDFFLVDSDKPLMNAPLVSFEMTHTLSGNVLSLSSVTIC